MKDFNNLSFWGKVKYVFADIGKSIKEDSDSRFFHLMVVLLPIFSHSMVTGFAAHYFLGMTQMLFFVAVVGLALRQSAVKAQAGLVKEALNCVNVMEKRYHRDQERIKFLEDTLEAYKGHPEIRSEATTLN